jgi:hypothetical protein
MPDANQQYPLPQPGGNGRHQPFDDDSEDEFDDEGIIQEPKVPDRGPFHQREVPSSPQLPRGRFKKTLLIGAIAGVIAALQGIIFTLANSSLYHTVSTTPQDKLSLGLAEAVFGLFCLTIFINLLIYFVAGFFTGKATVERRMGFLVGFVAEGVAYILALLVQQIPGYPNAQATGFHGGVIGFGGGLIVALIFLAISGVIAGLVSLTGAWLATRRHPYYYMR